MDQIPTMEMMPQLTVHETDSEVDHMAIANAVASTSASTNQDDRTDDFIPFYEESGTQKGCVRLRKRPRMMTAIGKTVPLPRATATATDTNTGQPTTFAESSANTGTVEPPVEQPVPANEPEPVPVNVPQPEPEPIETDAVVTPKSSPRRKTNITSDRQTRSAGKSKPTAEEVKKCHTRSKCKSVSPRSTTSSKKVYIYMYVYI